MATNKTPKKGQPKDTRKRCPHGEINCIECMSRLILGDKHTRKVAKP